MAREGRACRRIIRRSPAIQSIQMESAVNPIRMVLNGGYPPGTAGNPRPYGMPPFAQRLSDDEVAAVVTYIRAAWGNRGDAGLVARRPTSCAPRRWIEARMINSDRHRPTTITARRRDEAVDAIVAIRPARARSRWPASRPPSSSAIWFAFYLLVFLPRASGAMSDRMSALHDDGARVAPSASSGAGPRSSVAIVVLLVVMATFAGTASGDDAAEPRRDRRSAHACTCRANSSKAISAARSSPTAR